MLSQGMRPVSQSGKLAIGKSAVTQGFLKAGPLYQLCTFSMTSPVIVHVHEEVLAPLGARLGVVAKNNAFEFHTQRRLRR